ncbi:golgi family reassembly stacking protein (GRASP like proteinue) [Trypanosoma conorhini]|uniref:Golgi family reassembly stacking protein (GRASP like proteinue) n=1 Tax=Trypanosoma conorhini TaxID=83891 RepID=A0A422N8G2_9TRYP|nr:golgi family reassembly stacking protein (GRASP like proteinue) [Trypanosoma conorhini]RNF01768.1 golgi family reassembly stacking protein (GRASP like proteinue) [Trypanosoma conorhini]
MGQKESKVDSALAGICGLQVARVLPRSPAHNAGLVPFFDIITAIDDALFANGADAVMQFRSRVSQRVNQQLSLRVYNLHVRAYREVVCTPSSSWGGTGLLGCSIEWCRAEECGERSWHIVDVLPGTPAALCEEIDAGRDYIIGMQRAEEPVVTLLKDEDDFHGRVELWRSLQRVMLQRLARNSKSLPQGADGTAAVGANIGRLILLIYNSATNEVKEVAVDLGPEVDAPLGLDLAAGLLHSLLVSSPTEGCKNISDGNGGAESNNTDNGTSSTNRKGELPRMTTFLLPSGETQRCLPMAPSETLPVVSKGRDPRAEPATPLPAQPLAPPPAAHTTPVQPALHSLPMPPPKPVAEKERETQGQDYFMAPYAVGMKAAMPAEAKTEVGVSSGLPVTPLGRPTIPVISRSRPTAAVGNGVEGVPHAHVGPETVAAQAPLPVTKQKEHKLAMQEGKEPPIINPSSLQCSGPVADVVSTSNASLTADTTLHPPQLPAFPKLPPPLHFPIIRPASPTGKK